MWRPKGESTCDIFKSQCGGCSGACGRRGGWKRNRCLSTWDHVEWNSAGRSVDHMVTLQWCLLLKSDLEEAGNQAYSTPHQPLCSTNMRIREFCGHQCKWGHRNMDRDHESPSQLPLFSFRGNQRVNQGIHHYLLILYGENLVNTTSIHRPLGTTPGPTGSYLYVTMHSAASVLPK